MRSILFLSLFFAPFCFAGEAAPKIDFSLNFREDSLHWSIAGVDRMPNVASLLKWNRIRSVGAGACFGAVICNRFPLEIKGSYNKIFAGENEDLDFSEDNKRGLFLKSIADASRGELFDIRGELGMQLSYWGCCLVPHVGYSLDEQHLREFDGFTVFNALDPDDVGPIKGLHSGYNAAWYGPYIGAKGQIPLFKGTLGVGFDYFYPTYRARGHANLRTDIVGQTFNHRANGWGREFFAAFQSRIEEKLLVEVKFKFGRFWTKKGVESERLLVDETIVPIKIDLKRTEWSAKSISAHIIKKF